MRKKIIAGNWKMNKTPTEAVVLATQIKENVTKMNCTVVVCPTYVCLEKVVDAVKGQDIFVGAQNLHYLDNGAYTGEISADMLNEIGVSYVIIGHSERRQYYNETDETVHLKTKKALEKGLIPIVCVGESLSEREGDLTSIVLAEQISKGLTGITEIEKVVIAYEPIWAIGTGKVATNEQANDACKFIRAEINKTFGEMVANNLRILYGGSMNAQNAGELLKQSDIDGGLIGGASLKSEDFIKIIECC